MANNSSIADSLTRGNNSFGLLRLIAASAVVISHAWVITSGSSASEPILRETGFTLGWHAVNLFFVLSGLLIAGSLHHSRSIEQFFWSRFLRIYPALFVVVCTTLFAAALLVESFSLQLTTFAEFLVTNLLFAGAYATLPGVFVDNPWSGFINPPLWTLNYEVLAYTSIVVLAAIAKRSSGLINSHLLTFTILLVTGSILLLFDTQDFLNSIEDISRFAFAFSLGVAAWQWRDQLKVNGFDFFLISMANVGLIMMEIQFQALYIMWFAYGGLWLGTRTYGWISAFTDRQDYSYGIYIIGYPVQQTVVAYTGILDPWVNIAISLPIVLILACCSWNLVEKPALRLKKSLPRLVSAQSS